MNRKNARSTSSSSSNRTAGSCASPRMGFLNMWITFAQIVRVGPVSDVRTSNCLGRPPDRQCYTGRRPPAAPVRRCAATHRELILPNDVITPRRPDRRALPVRFQTRTIRTLQIELPSCSAELLSWAHCRKSRIGSARLIKAQITPKIHNPPLSQIMKVLNGLAAESAGGVLLFFKWDLRSASATDWSLSRDQSSQRQHRVRDAYFTLRHHQVKTLLLMH